MTDGRVGAQGVGQNRRFGNSETFKVSLQGVKAHLICKFLKLGHSVLEGIQLGRSVSWAAMLGARATRRASLGSYPFTRSLPPCASKPPTEQIPLEFRLIKCVCIGVPNWKNLIKSGIGGAFEMTATVFQKSDSHETHRNIRKPQRGPESF